MQERKQFKKSIADFQATQFKLADMAGKIMSSRLMLRLESSFFSYICILVCARYIFSCHCSVALSYNLAIRLSTVN